MQVGAFDREDAVSSERRHQPGGSPCVLFDMPIPWVSLSWLLDIRVGAVTVRNIIQVGLRGPVQQAIGTNSASSVLEATTCQELRLYAL
eukprot:6402336-Amphidinium_carterae.2